MSDSTDSIRISLLLADGKHFPVFYYGDPDSRTLSLVPATRGQDQADVQFFCHSADASPPVLLGVLRFPDLPPDTPELELRLDATIEVSGFLKVVLTHLESGRSESLVAALPGVADDSPVYRDVIPPRREGRVLMGIAFVLAGLALVFWLTLMVTRIGRQDAAPPPLTGRSGENRPV